MSHLGSSPLARGTSRPRSCASHAMRLIPARAGNISAAGIHHLEPSAHPRSRGEHAQSDEMAEDAGGSSPLARGTWWSSSNASMFTRLIPARAGNIPGHPSETAATPAHPRSRGEHLRLAFFASSSAGSSPLARGTSFQCRQSMKLPRLIPARAGNILADMGVYPLHQQNRITLKPEPHPGYTINSHS